MKSQKHLFSLDPEVHYLNCSYKAPLMKAAEEAAIKELVRERNPIGIAQLDFFTEVEKVRVAFGKLINCAAANVALVPSTSYGFSSVLNNVIAKPKGNVITIKDEFPSGYFALEKWAKDHGNEMRIIGPDENDSQMGPSWNRNILDAIDDQTSVVLMSSIHWMNGLKFDLMQIGEKCKTVGAKLIVDGSQSVGALEMDVAAYQIDALVCASYKWLFGAYSVALAYFSDEFQNGTPLEESWMNRTNAKDFTSLANYEAAYTPHAGRYNVGEASSFMLMPIVKHGLQQIHQWSVDGIQAYCGKLIAPLLKYLDENGFSIESEPYFCNHLFALRLPSGYSPEALSRALEINKVYLSMRGEYLRVATNVFNDEADIEALILCLKEAKR